MKVHDNLGALLIGMSSSGGVGGGSGGGMNDGLSKIAFVLISTLFSYFIHYIFENITTITYDLSVAIMTMKTLFAKKIHYQMVIFDTSSDCYVKTSEACKAITYYIDKNADKLKGIDNMKEMFVTTSTFYYSECDDGGGGGRDDVKRRNSRNTSNIIDQSGLVLLTNELGDKSIYCNVSIVKETNDNKMKINNIHITLYSFKSIGHIKDFVDECIALYMKDMQEKIHKQKYIFLLNSVKDGEMKYTEIPFTSNKTFDNMFFPGKEEFIRRIKYFMENKDKYDEVSMPYTLGILMHGKAGTGKTSALKAIANYMGRHIIIVPTGLVNTNDVLIKLFCDSNFNDKYIPIEKRLYVIEEIDCGGWKDIVVDRSGCSGNKDSYDGGCNEDDSLEEKLIETLKGINGDVKCSVKDKKKDKDGALTLANLLEMLDGVVETPGRVIVFTSNHPEKLDKALLRPGRINIKMEFKCLEKEDVRRMYNLWFRGENIPDHVYAKMKDYVFTQAEIGELFIEYMNDRKGLYRVLMSRERVL